MEIRNGDYNNKAELINAAKEAAVAKIVYTSIFGEVGDTSFSPIISSNRKTEEDIMNSGLEWGYL